MTHWGRGAKGLLAACALVLTACIVLIGLQAWPQPPEVLSLTGAAEELGNTGNLLEGTAAFTSGLPRAEEAANPARIPVNTATKEELMTLPGIGEHLAGLIIAAREKHPFHFPEDLMTVPGIGERRLQQIQDFIEIP